NGSGIDLSKAMKGWSEARIKAFKAIKTKPNTYYYRFNAPGEEQRTGQWTAEEQKLFHARLKEIGANGQWGIFSMTIPGRVGYQCSNYYRYLVENRLIHDPNYVLDEKGKAHFLFTTKKKNPDGTAMRVFRKHKKPHVRMSREKYGYSDSDEDDNDDEEAEQSTASSARGGRRAADSQQQQQQPVTAVDFADSEVPAKPAASEGTAGSAASTRKSTRAAAGVRKRKRRGRFADYSSDEDVIRANEVELSDDGGANSDTSDGEFCGPAVLKRRCGGRRRNGSSSALNTDSGNSSAVEAPARGRGRVAGGSASDAGGDNADDSGESEVCSGASGDEIDPSNPLPDLLDPITLEPVSKPAISPYGH
ncbi:hypothetical protein LPJ56_006835, partial [Coemansia sp. RSA 2599]